MTRLKQLKTAAKAASATYCRTKRPACALDDRQETIRAERDSANKWREERHKSLLPDLREVAFPDHLKPLILVSLNTGMRRGEVFNLTWADIDLKNKLITVEGDTSKSGQTRHIPMNKETVATIEEWRKQYPVIPAMYSQARMATVWITSRNLGMGY